MEKNLEEKTLEKLEREVWPDVNEADSSYLIKTCHALRKKQLQHFTTEDLRIMIGQEIGLQYLIPIAIETLSNDLFAEGDYYEGDLLKNVLAINTDFWNHNKNYRQQLNDIIKDRRDEITDKKFDTTNFDRSI